MHYIIIHRTLYFLLVLLCYCAHVLMCCAIVPHLSMFLFVEIPRLFAVLGPAQSALAAPVWVCGVIALCMLSMLLLSLNN
jgi:hypothetical protein